MPIPYRGWSTREAWLVHSWITNDTTTWEKYKKLAQEGEANKDVPPLARVSMLAFMLSEDLYASTKELPIPDMFIEMLRVSLARVDWCEVAEALIKASA